MGFEQIIHFMKQVQGKISSNVYAPLQGQTNPQHHAFLRQLQKEANRADSLRIPLKELNVVVFDLETTGFFPDQGDLILSIGAVKVKGGEIQEKDFFYSLVQHDQALSEEIKELTGLCEEELSNAPPLVEVLARFFEFVEKDTLVAHHANHEKQFLQHVTWKLLRSQFQHRIIDTSLMVKLAEPTTNLVRLEDCCSHYGIEIQDRHHALGDAIMTAKLWVNCMNEIAESGCQSLQDVYEKLGRIT
jgi:DNA polymerase-3 subunit epsilon